MSESVVFTCDFCGTKSEPESSDWPRTRRGRVELVLPAQRFHAEPRSVEPAAYEGGAFPPMIPFFPGPVGAAFPPSALSPTSLSNAAAQLPSADAAEAPEEEDNRFVATLCDQCMRRVAGLFDVKVETQEEYVARSLHHAYREPLQPLPPSPTSVRSPASARPPASAGVDRASGYGMIGKVVAQFPNEPPAPNSGGLVQQFPTPQPHETEETAAAASVAAAAAASAVSAASAASAEKPSKDAKGSDPATWTTLQGGVSGP